MTGIGKAAAIVLVAASACAPPLQQAPEQNAAGGTAPAATQRTTLVTAAQNGTDVTLESGATLVVELEANLTTAYAWRVTELPPNLILVDETYEGTGSPEMVGSGGISRFTFRAEGPGQGRLRLDHDTGANRNAPGSRTFSVNVVVR